MDKTRLKKLMLPLLLEQLLGVSVGMADTFMVSRVGEAAVSGVSLVNNLNLLIMQVMAALAAGGTVVMSQHLGDKNESMARKAGVNLEFLMIVFSAFVMSICVFLDRPLLGFLFKKVEDDVMEAAVVYLLFLGLSFIFWGEYTAGAAILRCQENTKTAMQVSVLMNFLNIALNALFVFGLHWGAMGVALATLISRAVAGVTMKVVLLSAKNGLRTKGTWLSDISRDVVKSILAMGVPSGIENGMFHVGKIMVAGMLATLGTSAIAANSIAFQIIEFPNIPGGTIGLALVIIVGQDIGAGNKEGAVKNSKYMLRLAYFGDWVCKGLLFLTAPFIVAAFKLSPEATDIAVQVLRLFCIASIPVWPLSFTLPNALRGAGDVKYSMIVSVISMWLCRVLVTYILVMSFDLGILGIWLGMFADWFVRGGGYLSRFHSRKWLEKKAV